MSTIVEVTGWIGARGRSSSLDNNTTGSAGANWVEAAACGTAVVVETTATDDDDAEAEGEGGDDADDDDDEYDEYEDDDDDDDEDDDDDDDDEPEETTTAVLLSTKTLKKSLRHVGHESRRCVRRPRAIQSLQKTCKHGNWMMWRALRR